MYSEDHRRAPRTWLCHFTHRLSKWIQLTRPNCQVNKSCFLAVLFSFNNELMEKIAYSNRLVIYLKAFTEGSQRDDSIGQEKQAVVPKYYSYYHRYG